MTSTGCCVKHISGAHTCVHNEVPGGCGVCGPDGHVKEREGVSGTIMQAGGLLGITAAAEGHGANELPYFLVPDGLVVPTHNANIWHLITPFT